MCKSAIYVANTTAQAVSSGASVNFGSVIHKFGDGISLVGGNVVEHGIGYYTGNVMIDYTGPSTASTSTTFTVLDNSVPIVGATTTVTTGASASETVVIPFMTRNNCCMDHTITVVANQDITGVTASMIVQKIR